MLCGKLTGLSENQLRSKMPSSSRSLFALLVPIPVIVASMPATIVMSVSIVIRHVNRVREETAAQ